ncbi:MAG TPA: hypothetical protein VHY84_05515 [Bryobacteraceae bacterium]|jgi:hypothetical protein|nr:hypothetical protein [Bryobacteraceae bacterium]
MTSKFPKGRTAPVFVIAAGLALSLAGSMFGQRGRGGPPPVPLTPKANAPEDITGNWVSIVTEDWRFRMVTPAKGDYASVPLNGPGRAMANTWDPAKDEAAGEQCKSYGAPGLMRVPGRLHITWPDEKTIKVEMDSGTQTRVFHFNAPPPADEKPSLQGYSIATWDGPPPGRGARGPMRAGSLKVVTTHLKPGYLRKNGVPYSANTVLTEYYSRTKEDNGDSWLIITTIVDDPMYLAQPFITSTHFKMEPNGSKWMPSACEAK